MSLRWQSPKLAYSIHAHLRRLSKVEHTVNNQYEVGHKSWVLSCSCGLFVPYMWKAWSPEKTSQRKNFARVQ